MNTGNGVGVGGGQSRRGERHEDTSCTPFSVHCQLPHLAPSPLLALAIPQALWGYVKAKQLFEVGGNPAAGVPVTQLLNGHGLNGHGHGQWLHGHDPSSICPSPPHHSGALRGPAQPNEPASVAFMCRDLESHGCPLRPKSWPQPALLSCSPASVDRRPSAATTACASCLAGRQAWIWGAWPRRSNRTCRRPSRSS